VEVVNELRCILGRGALRATLAQSIPVVTANLGESRDDRLDLTPVGAGTATTGFENDCGSVTGSLQDRKRLFVPMSHSCCLDVAGLLA